MLKKTKYAVALVVALSAMAVGASAASALEASVSPAGRMEATSSSVTFEGSGIAIRCALTLTNSLLAGPINSAAGNQIGEVTGVSIGACSGGEVESVLGLPWRITTNTVLPANAEPRTVTGLLVNIVGSSFNLSTFFGIINCLYRGDAGALMALTATSRGASSYSTSTIRALETVSLPFVRGSGACPANGHFSGTFNIAPRQTISVT